MTTRFSTLSRWFLTMTLVGFLATVAHGQLEDSKTVDAYKAGGGVVVDGQADALWDAIAWEPINLVIGDPFAPPQEGSAANFKVAYDANHLYILVNVVDDVLATYTEGGAAWRDDSIELFFDFAADGGAYDDQTYQVYFRSETDGEYYWGANSTTVEEPMFARAHTTTADGYQVEFALPWSAFGVDPSATMEIGFDINVNDADPNEGGWPPARLVWNNAENNSSETADNFGTVVLSDQIAPRKMGMAVEDPRGIMVDGMMDENWALAPWMDIDTLIGEPFAEPVGPFAARYKLMYDDARLYLLVDVTDDVLATYTDGGRAWRDDGLEIFFDFGEPGGAYDDQTYQVYFRSETDGEFYWGANSARIDEPNFTRAHTVTDDGYMVEFSLAWSDFGVNPNNLTTLPFDINVNDADPNEGGFPPTRLVWNNLLNDSSNSADNLGWIEMLPRKETPVIEVREPIVIDGEVDAGWDAAPVNNIDILLGDPWAQPTTPFSANYRVAYDEQHLYVLVDVVDDILATYTEGGRAWRDDSIEFFLDFGVFGGAYDQFTYQIYFRSNTDDTFYWGANSARPDGVTLQRTHVMTGSGYRVEFALAWAELGVDPSMLERFGMDINVNDADINEGGFPPSRLIWSNALNDSSNTADNFGMAYLAPLQTAMAGNVSSSAISIDGEVDAAWDAAPWYDIDLVMPLPWAQPLVPFSARFKATYDDDKLYFLVDVVDDMLMTWTDGGRAWRDDGIELFLDFAADGGAYDDQTFQIYFRSETEDTFYWGANSTRLDGVTVERAHMVTDDGYHLEFALTWSEFGVDPTGLDRIGFDINVNDGDPNEGGFPPSRLIWNNAVNNSSNHAGMLGFLALAAAEAPPFALLVNAVPNGDGSYTSPWLGTFSFESPDGNWVFHWGMGLTYVGSASSPDGMWLYVEALDIWAYTEPSWFPIIWQGGGFAVVFYNPEIGGWIYLYDENAWVQVHP